MAVRFEVVAPARAVGPALRADLLATWIAVTNAGGSVGFTAPAPEDAVAAKLDSVLRRVAAGQDALGVLRSGGSAVGMGCLVDRGSSLCRHWRTVAAVMVHPAHQGAGAGLSLMTGLHGLGRRLGLEHLQLTVRDGHGLEGFYARAGYVVVGRHPAAIRVGPDDDRDEVMLVARLTADCAVSRGSTWSDRTDDPPGR
jgi:GNAT superfamily N-acetyltransferase